MLLPLVSSKLNRQKESIEGLRMNIREEKDNSETKSDKLSQNTKRNWITSRYKHKNTKKFIDFGNISSRKVLGIAVDEDESN